MDSNRSSDRSTFQGPRASLDFATGSSDDLTSARSRGTKRVSKSGTDNMAASMVVGSSNRNSKNKSMLSGGPPQSVGSMSVISNS